jgi:uncharacterized protein YqeY
MPTDSELMRLRLQSDLRDAMKAKDRVKIDVLRTLMAAIDNASAVSLDAPTTPSDPRTDGYSQYVVTGAGKTEVERRALTNDDIARIFATEAAERRASAGELAQHGKLEAAAALRESAAFIDAYLSD